MAREIEMKVSIDTTKSEIKLLKLQDELKNLKKEAKSISEDDKAFGQWAEAINSTENEMAKLKQSMKQSKTETNITTKGFKTLGDKISGAFENAGKKAKRFTLALFSVRTIFSVISKASSNYLSENEQTSNAVAGAWEYLGNVIGPVIERVVSWLRYGIAYLNVFLKALTGVDFLAKSIQKTTAKTNKELKKTVSSMDEIVNLDLDSGGSANPAGALQEIADLELNPEIVTFMEKLGKATKEVWDFAVKAWNFLEEHFGTTGAMAIVGGLALIIGGAGKGLIGVSSLLGGLATIGTIAISVDLLYGSLTGRDLIQDLKDINQGFKDLKEISKMNNNASNKLTTSWNNTTSSWDFASMSAEQLDKVIEILSDDTDSTIEKSDRLTKQMEEQGSMYIDNRDAIKDTVDELNGNKSALQRLKEQLVANRGELQKGTEEYNRNERAIRNVENQLSLIDHKITHAELNLEISSNASTFRYNMYKVIDNIFGYWTDKVNRASAYGGGGSFGYGSGGGFRASGGKVDNGQMFIANEAGPELVGNIGSTTAVLNNNQIVESVSLGVANAVSSVLSTGNNKNSQNASYIYINGSEFAKAIYPDMQAESLRRNTNTSIRRV